MSVEIVSWADGTDEQIAAMLDAAAAGQIDLQQDAGWKVGDKRLIPMQNLAGSGMNQQNEIVITSFEEYMGCGNLLQFDFEDSPDTNRVRDGGLGYRHTIISRYEAGYYVSAMPVLFQHRLKTFDVLYNAGDEQTENIVRISGNKLACRSRREVFGDGPNEGTQIAYYSIAKNRIKNKNTYYDQKNGTALEPYAWWLRTSNNDKQYSIVSATGTLDSANGDSYNLGVSLFGCLGGYNDTLLKSPISIDEYNFPDDAFRNAISEFDLDKDGFLNQYELEKITSLNQYDKFISFRSTKSVVGIELLTCLEEIHIWTNYSPSIKLTDETIDLSSLKHLKSFGIIDAPKIKNVIFHGSELLGISFRDCYNLEQITFVNDPLKLEGITVDHSYATNVYRDIDVSRCRNLKYLQFTGFICNNIDIRNNPRLLLAHSAPQNVPSLTWEYGTLRAGSSAKGTVRAIKTEVVYNAGYNPLKELYPDDDLELSTYRLVYDEQSNVITNAFAITSEAEDVSAREGVDATFHCEAEGEEAIQYSWEYRNYFTNMASYSIKDWTQIGTGQDLTIKASSWLEYHVFRCKVYSPSSYRPYYLEDKDGSNRRNEYRYHLYNYTRIAHLKVYYPVTITEQPQDNVNIIGGVASFTVEASNDPPEVVKDEQTSYHPDRTQTDIIYTWQKIGPSDSEYVDIPNATTKAISVIVSEDNKGYKYRCKVSDGTNELISNEVKVIVVDNLEGRPAFLKDPEDLTIMEGTSGIFSVEVFGDNLSYQWQASSDQGETWTDIHYATNASFEVLGSIMMTGLKYRCRAYNDIGEAFSKSALLNVYPDTRLLLPSITTQPSSIAVSEGENATFIVATEGEDLHYQWQMYQNEKWYSINGATGSSYTVTGAKILNGVQYRCIVSNAAGAVYSNSAYLSVTSVNTVTTPTIYTNPTSRTILEGETATFLVTAKGRSLSYQWQIKRGNSWYDVTGATNAIYTTRASKDLNGAQYRCRISNAAGTIYSSSATLTVRELGPIPIYGYHSIIISGKNTYGEWEMYPTSRPHVAPPEVKTSYVDVPGADGGLDYTELLNDKPNYGYRKGSWEFLLIPQEKWPDVYHSLCNYLHGREHTVVLEDDPNVVYTGRLSVNQWQSAAHNSLITIDYILDPVALNTQDESYNPDEEYLAGAEKILRRPENVDCVLALWNDQITIVPIDSLYEDGDNIVY